MPIHLDSDFIFIFLCFCILILILALHWGYKTLNSLIVRSSVLEQKCVALSQDLQQTTLQGKAYTDSVVAKRMQPIEEALADVSRFTQAIDMNIRLLISKIDQTVGNKESN